MTVHKIEGRSGTTVAIAHGPLARIAAHHLPPCSGWPAPEASPTSQTVTDAAAQRPNITPDLSSILGQAAGVMMHSPLHKHMFVQDLEWLLMPPIGLKQFRLWRRDNLPVAFASWAFLNDEAATRLAAGVRRLAPAEWRSGDQLWLIDLVCPFGGTEEIMRRLKEETFKSRKVKSLQPAPGGQGVSVVEW